MPSCRLEHFLLLESSEGASNSTLPRLFRPLNPLTVHNNKVWSSRCALKRLSLSVPPPPPQIYQYSSLFHKFHSLGKNDKLIRYCREVESCYIMFKKLKGSSKSDNLKVRNGWKRLQQWNLGSWDQKCSKKRWWNWPTKASEFPWADADETK